MSVSNVICTLCFGKRFEPEDPEFVRLLENNQEFSKLLAQSGPLQAYPSLRFFPGSVKAAWNAIVQINRQMIDTMTAKIQEHRNTYDSNETRDYIDKFLHHQAAEAASPNGIQPPFYGIRGTKAKPFRVSSAPERKPPPSPCIGVSCSCCTILMVQNKIHQELDNTVGAGKPITIDDRRKLPT
ncbi:hypothetical protein BV898_09957 [Hypsibius exemplaris]|uniref:Uncharacterized protein n=1 Tax=Hypsibius exemplaris TaxID=2072580 RepID=A0A1W0WKW2_HYPEX|nr:hypothetical protein BV898_09957 [Hypsibius exemplaris]